MPTDRPVVPGTKMAILYFLFFSILNYTQNRKKNITLFQSSTEMSKKYNFFLLI